MRLLEANFTPSEGAGRIEKAGELLNQVKEIVGARARAALTDEERRALPVDVDKVIGDLTDSWRDFVRRRDATKPLHYAPAVKGEVGLLYEPLEKNPPRDSDNAKFKAQRSMREVEPNVNLYVKVPDFAQRGA